MNPPGIESNLTRQFADLSSLRWVPLACGLAISALAGLPVLAQPVAVAAPASGSATSIPALMLASP